MYLEIKVTVMFFHADLLRTVNISYIKHMTFIHLSVLAVVQMYFMDCQLFLGALLAVDSLPNHSPSKLSDVL